MKVLLLIPFLLLSFLLKAQNTRWMYLSKGLNGSKYLVDTLGGDIKQLASYDDHYSVVVLWTSVRKKTYSKKSISEHEYRYKIAVDTSKNQYEIKYYIEYRNGEVINSETYENIGWIDIIPDSMGEVLVKYVKSLQ